MPTFEEMIAGDQTVDTLPGELDDWADGIVAPWNNDPMSLQEVLMESRRKTAAESESWVPSIIREPFYGLASAGANLMGTVTRPFSKDMADYFAQMGEVGDIQAESERKTDYFPKFSKMLHGATSSMAQATVTAPAGIYGTAAGFAATEGNQALYEAEKAGLEGNDRLKYAAVQGAIEGGIMSVFNKFGWKGFEGLIPKIADGTMKSFGKEFVKASAQELPEEFLTEFGHALTEANWNVDPTAMDPDKLIQRAIDTAGQTLLTVGLAAGAGSVTRGKGVSETSPATTIEALLNNDQARRDYLDFTGERSRDVWMKDQPSRTDFESIGISEQTGKKQRQEIARKMRGTIWAQEAEMEEVASQDPIAPEQPEDRFAGMTPEQVQEHQAKEAEFGQPMMTPSEEASHQAALEEWRTQSPPAMTPFGMRTEPDSAIAENVTPPEAALPAEMAPTDSAIAENQIAETAGKVDVPPISDLAQRREANLAAGAAEAERDIQETGSPAPYDKFGMRVKPTDSAIAEKTPKGRVKTSIGDLSKEEADWFEQQRTERLDYERQQIKDRNDLVDRLLSLSGVPKKDRGTLKLELLRARDKADVTKVKGFDLIVDAARENPELGIEGTEGAVEDFLLQPFTQNDAGVLERIDKELAAELNSKRGQDDTSFDFGYGTTTGTKNAKTNEMREKTGMEERPPVQSESFEQWEEEARQRIAKDPTYAPKLAAEVSETPRVLDKAENAALGQYIQDLENRRNAGEDVLEEIATAVVASERGGSEAGRALVSRKAERFFDYSLAGIVSKHLDSVNETPSAEEMQNYAELADRIEKLEIELGNEQKLRAQAEIDARISKAKRKKNAPSEPSKKTPTKKRQSAEKNVADAWAEFKKAAVGRLGAGAPLDLLAPAVKVAKAYVELGVIRFSEFIAAVRQNMKDADESLFRSAWREAWGGDKPASDTPAIGSMARKLTRATVESGIEDREAVIDAVHEDLKAMGYEVSRSEAMTAMSGYGEFRELSKDEVSAKVRAIKGELQQLLKLEDMQGGKAPKKTGVERREPTDEERRLIKLVNEAKKKGGYQVTDPDKQLKTALSAAKTAASNRIADLEKAIAEREKIVSGQTKLKPDAELTGLRKKRDELNAEYRRLFPPTKKQQDEAQRIESAIKSAEREIAKLAQQLKTRNFDRTKPEAVSSKELDAKRKELNQLREARKAAKAAELARFEDEGGAIPNRTGLTEAARLRAAEKMLDRLITELKSDLYAGRLGVKEKKDPLTSESIEAKRKERDALKDARDKARAASPEYQAELEAKQTAQYKKTLERNLKFWEQRREDAEAGVLPKKRKPTPEDDAILEKKYQIELVRREAQAAIEEAERKNRSKAGKALGFGGDLLDLSQAIMTGYEMSAVLRQGAPYTLGFPEKALPAVWDALRAAFSRRADFALHDDLMQRANHADYVRGNMETTASDGPLSHREELIRSRLASLLARKEGAAWALPRWAAEGLLGSERAFRAFANTMRADLFDYMKGSVQASRPGTWSGEDARIVGSASNVFSGRGELPTKLSGLAGVGGARIFFAPKWIWSRGQLLVGQPLWKGDKATRLAVGKVYVRGMLGFAGLMLIRHALYSLLADDDEHKPKYETDLRSTDSGKTRLGDTRIDSGAGFNQLLTLEERVRTGETKTGSGKIVSIRGDDVKPGTDDVRDILHRFLDSKLAPLPSAVLDFMAGENVVGEKATVGKIVTDRVSPMTWRDIWAAEKELGVKQGTVAAIDAFFGAGVSTYGDRSKYRDASEEERQKQIEKDLKKLEWDDPEQPPYSEYLTEDQRKQFSDRRRKKRSSVVYQATSEPIRKNSKSDESYAENIKERDENRERLKSLKDEGVTYAEAVKMLQEHYRASGFKIGSPSYQARLRKLGELLRE